MFLMENALKRNLKTKRRVEFYFKTKFKIATFLYYRMWNSYMLLSVYKLKKERNKFKKC